VRRPGWTLGLLATVVVVAAVAATQLKTSASPRLLVSPGSAVAQAGDELQRDFGADPIIVSLAGDLQNTVGKDDLVALLGLEGDIARSPGVASVYGPGTFVNQTIIQIDNVIKQELGSASLDNLTPADVQKYKALLVRFGSIGPPALDNRTFVLALVYGSGTTPKRRFQWLFPDNQHAVILVRPDRGLDGPAATALAARIRSLASAAGLNGVRVQVAGIPLLAAGLERATHDELLRLAPVAIGAMLLLLLLVLWRRRAAVLPLILALAGTTVALGLSGPLGLGMTLGTVAALPVVLGLGLDFGVQLQARYWVERAAGGPREAAASAALRGVGPTLGLAAVAMSVGFLALVAGPVPLLHRLGAVLALGTLANLGIILVAGPLLLSMIDRGPARPIRLRPVTLRVPRVFLGVLLVLAVAGLAVSSQTKLQSDITALAPKGLPELRQVDALQRDLGTSGQLSVAVEADNVTAPAVIDWMGTAQQKILALDSHLRPGPDLAGLITSDGAVHPADQAGVDAKLKLLPKYFLDAVLTPDHRTAQMTFALPLASGSAQAALIKRVDRILATAPAGVRATPAGLVAAAATSADSLEHTRPGLLLLAAALVALVLLAAWRRPARVLLVLGPALLAAGISALVLVISGIRLSPLGAALEPLVLAIGLEFAMLMEMRYRQVRDAGADPAAARAAATAEIGGAVALSAATVALGFATLVLSHMSLLSQLGWLVALELALCLVMTIALVPAGAEWLDRRAARASKSAPPRVRTVA
jgi:predicted RND superfamily exporter protein